MPKPILLAIDDDTSVLEAVVQDLRRHYGQDYRIVRAASGVAALDICRQLHERKDTVALFLSDQRMPGMTGVDFLQQALTIYPNAKRVLLTAYADTEAAIRAINSAKIHYYLNKPWDPPEEKLYPVLDDLLETWKEGYKPPYEGIIVVGTRWSSADHNVREFLSRNRVPYQWLSPEQHPEAVELLKERGLDDSKLPVVIFGDSTALVQPTSNDLATKLGMPGQAQQKFYDVVIVVAGPGGIATGVAYRKVDIPGAEEFTGSGVYYGAALAEAKSCADEIVYIVGGANSAGQAAMYFSRYAGKVHMLVRADSLNKSMSKYLIDQIKATPNITVETCTEVVAMSGNGHLECLTLKTPRGEQARPVTSLFIFISAAPKTDWLPKEIALDGKGFILAGPDLKAQSPKSWTLDRDPYLLETSVPGIFVAGDVRFNSVKRCASAVGEGSIAIQFVHQYLATL